MTLHFAAARGGAASPVARALSRRVVNAPANDNAFCNACPERILEAALRHFAIHGLSAAATARDEARRAHAGNDADGFSWWIEVCRALDRRMAFSFERSLAGACPAQQRP